MRRGQAAQARVSSVPEGRGGEGMQAALSTVPYGSRLEKTVNGRYYEYPNDCSIGSLLGDKLSFGMESVRFSGIGVSF